MIKARSDSPEPMILDSTLGTAATELENSGAARSSERATPPRPATIYDVAQAAGVSTQTVSRVVNNHPCVRPEKVAKVKAAIGLLSYVPNESARDLGSRRPHG
jgi:hypothetical protein